MTENVANNVVNENSQDLTSQWKKGELPSGWYYTKLWKGCNVIDYFIGNQFLRYDDSDIVEVIAPVPSYDELQNMNEAVNQAMSANIKLVEQNAQLKKRVSKLEKMQYSYTTEEWNTMLRTVNRTKDLLKECQHILKEQNFYRNTPIETDTAYRTRCLKKQELLTKIDEALK